MFGSVKSGNNGYDEQPEHNIFFEGGEIEFGIDFEGGSEDDGPIMT